ncbi:MAG TPA: hypothetical protein VH158_05130 [Gemmatimonadales bacterium]|nr:hypothetical protein [Gemmatimonadales bacterium]
MTARRVACGLWLAASASACLSERPRPAPPALAVVLQATAVHSTTPNDTLGGSVRVEDAAGIDSVWLQVDGTTAAADGLLAPIYQSPFRVAIPAGLAAGTRVPVSLAARDVVGFRSQSDTFVTVVP